MALKSLFALLQKNVLDRQRWTSSHELRLAIVSWIETTYQRRLGQLTHIEFETLEPVALAARAVIFREPTRLGELRAGRARQGRRPIPGDARFLTVLASSRLRQGGELRM